MGPKSTGFMLLSMILLSFPGLGAEETLLLRSPTVSGEHVAFVYAGDLCATGSGESP